MKKKILFFTVLIITLSYGLLYAGYRSVKDITILSSGTHTAATAYSSSYDVSAYSEGVIFVDVTTESGTSTLDVTLQYSPDNSTWYTHTAITQITATGQYDQAITNYGKYIRAKYVVGGTSFTFSIKGTFKN